MPIAVIRPAVLVMARVPRPSVVPGPLEAALGSQRWSALQKTLLSRVITWGQEVAPDAVYVAYEPAGGGGAGGERVDVGAGEPVEAGAGELVDASGLAGPGVTTFL